MMKRIAAVSAGVVIVITVAVLSSPSWSYQRYNDGCQSTSCHGAFTDSRSTKGSTFPSSNKHVMHRDVRYMDADCALCHRQDDTNNPFIGSSDGTAANAGLGCTGCHVAGGLRKHHQANNVTVCYTCHAADPTPPAENVPPPYYGTVDTKVKDPCNPTAQTNINENWTTNCCEGSDTDGDNLYDGADPDCQAASPTPGEAGPNASQMRVTAYDKASGNITVSYGAACSSTNNNVEFGPLSSLASYGYNGQVCAIGNTGSATFTVPNGNFFLVVAHNATVEGSYGKRRSGATLNERPEDNTVATCPKPQALALRCDP
jgi:hypothetical protein